MLQTMFVTLVKVSWIMLNGLFVFAQSKMKLLVLEDMFSCNRSSCSIELNQSTCFVQSDLISILTES